MGVPKNVSLSHKEFGNVLSKGEYLHVFFELFEKQDLIFYQTKVVFLGHLLLEWLMVWADEARIVYRGIKNMWLRWPIEWGL